MLVSQHNPAMQDIAQALTNSLSRDGRGPMLGPLAMGGNRISGIGPGIAPGDAATIDQITSADDNYPDLASLKAATPARLAYVLATESGPVNYVYVLGDFTGRADNVNVVKLNVVPLSTGALVRQSSDSVSFIQAGAGAKVRDAQNKAREIASVLDFGADPTGAADSTAAFNAAIDTKKEVFVPLGTYSVAGIKVVDGMQVVGEKIGDSETTPKLVVRTAGKAAFYNAATTNVSSVTLANMSCEAGPGILDARFYDQATSTFYSAYFTFRSIETYLSLSISYKGLFIYARWDQCRDAYYGSATNTSHIPIQALAFAYGQTNRQNINYISGSRFFSAYGGQGAIICSYATKWVVEGTGFEALKTAIFRGYNATQIEFKSSWFEGIEAAALFALSDLNGDYSSISFDACAVVLTNPLPSFFATIESGTVSVRNSVFNLIPFGMRLINNGARIAVNDGNILDGAGAANFMDGAHADMSMGGRRQINGAIDNGFAGMTFQNKGGLAATGGLMSNHDIAVGSSFVTVATSVTGLGGSCVISGFDPMGGGQFRVTKDWQGTTVRDVVVLLNNTGKVLTFQAVGNDLQMKCDVGMLNVFTTLNH